MRTIAVVTLLAAFVVPRSASARIDPLWQMTIPPVKAEVMLLLDTSRSMDLSGPDCPGWTNPDVDLADDFMCSGLEAYSNANDCDIASNATNAAGMPTACRSATLDRLYFTKRAIQNVIVDFGGSASFGFAIFNDTASNQYHRYFKATGASSTTVAILLTRLELASAGSWTGGAGWGGAGPQTFTGPDGVTVYTLHATKPNSLYRRVSGSLYAYKRYNYAGLTMNADGYTWTYIGSYFTYQQKTNAGTEYSTYRWINAAGTPFSPWTRAAVYKGPQFRATDGFTYVHYRTRHDDNQPGGYSGQALLLTAPVLDDGAQPLSAFESTAAAILNRVNTAFNGGLVGHSGGGTNNNAMMRLAHQVYIHRAAGNCTDQTYYTGGASIYGGTCPYTTPDPLASCRKRYAVLLTDGDSTDGVAATPAKNLYCEGCKFSDGSSGAASCRATFADPTGNCDPDKSNPIKTMAVGIAASNTDLTNTADWGYDGMTTFTGCKALSTACTADAECCSKYCHPTGNKCQQKYLYLTTNEAELTKAISGILSEAVAGDFVTASGSAASSDATTAGDYGIVTSLEYPGWKGHVRAFDLTQDPPVEVWDLASSLAGLANPYSRRIFSGEPRTDGGAFHELLDTSGNLVNEAKLKTLASAAGSTTVAGLSTANLTNFIRWVYGYNRPHRLGPIVRCVPAVIGPPPQRYLENHGTFEATHGDREPIIYVASNEGLIHAVRSGRVADGGGTEIFAFLPPNLLDKVYQLYLAGGQGTVADFKWIMAASPRVDDLYDGTNWSTQLIQPFGPKSYGFVQLDITRPTDSSKNLVPANLKVVALLYGNSSAGKLRTATNNDKAVTVGEAWSHPALYWTVTGTNTSEQRMSMGNGYGAASSADLYRTETAGHTYYYFDALWDTAQPKSSYTYTPGAGVLKVDYAAITDTVAVMDNSGAVPKVIAVYQADLDGRIMRYKEGMTGAADRKLIIPAAGDNPNYPFYYSPAALHIGGTTDNTVLLAAASGSADEPSPPAPSLETTLYLRSEKDGTVSNTAFNFTCNVSGLAACIPKDPSITNWPSNRAKPVTSPLILYSAGTTGAADLYYLLYEPSTSTSCSSAGGNSYLVHIQITNATTFQTKEVTKVPGKRAGGYIVSGGKVMITTSDTSGGTAGVHSPDGALPPPSPFLGTPRVEVWREVR